MIFDATSSDFIDFDVLETIEELRSVAAEMRRKEEIEIVGAAYDVKTGAVNFIDSRKIFKRSAEKAMYTNACSFCGKILPNDIGQNFPVSRNFTTRKQTLN